MHSAASTAYVCSPSTGRRSRNQGINIKQRISQWEGRTAGASNVENQQLKEVGFKTNGSHAAHSRTNSESSEIKKSGLVATKSLGLDFRDVAKSRNSSPQLAAEINSSCEGEHSERTFGLTTHQERKLENGNGDSFDPGRSLPPGNFYTSRGFWKKMEDIPNEADASVISDTEVKWERDIVPGKELEYRKFIGQSLHIQNPDDVYSESVVPASRVAINPVPKPQRTFRYLTEHDAFTNYAKHANKRIGTRPPLPSYPPPELKKYENESLKGKSKRKSYEFEDAEGLHILLTPSSSEKVQNESAELLKSALYHAQSEENIYEDIMDPARESPYEDIKYLPVILLKNTPPWKPGALKRALRPPKLPPKPPNLLRQISGSKNIKPPEKQRADKGATMPAARFTDVKDNQGGDGDKQKIPSVVLKIQEIFDAKRGKKRVRTQQPLGQDAAPSKGDYSDNESDTEDNQKGRRKRFVYVHSTLKRNPRYQTLEKDLIELQEQQLFELFVVVSLRKVSSKSGYTPEITQRFPNRFEICTRQSRETEERLKAIPKFCFPDSKTWTTMTDFTSETFSFVLTGEDGGRWFGYCRKLLPCGKGKRLPEVYCIVSRLGCFTLFSKILDEVEKRRNISPALVYPFMRSVMEAPFPAPGRTITVKNFLPGSGNEVIELCRPTDSRLEHIDFECLFQCLSIHHLVQVFASLLLERRVIFVADKLSTLSKCAHAVVALLYPFTWQHTYIPVLPASMIDITCSPTPFIIGILSASLPELSELPIEEVLVVDLCANSFLQQISDEENILPHKLQAALVYILEQRNDILAQERNTEEGEVTLSTLVSEAFVRFLVEIVGHYSLHMSVNEKGVRTFQQEAFRKSHTSRSVRQFLELFMETQMFAGFIQDRELRKSRVRGLFEQRATEYLESMPEPELSGVNRFLKELGNKMKFLQKK